MRVKGVNICEQVVADTEELNTMYYCSILIAIVTVVLLHDYYYYFC